MPDDVLTVGVELVVFGEHTSREISCEEPIPVSCICALLPLYEMNFHTASQKLSFQRLRCILLVLHSDSTIEINVVELL